MFQAKELYEKGYFSHLERLTWARDEYLNEDHEECKEESDEEEENEI